LFPDFSAIARRRADYFFMRLTAYPRNGGSWPKASGKSKLRYNQSAVIRRAPQTIFHSCSDEENTMKRTAYQPKDVFVPAGKSYSHGIIVEAGKTLYVAGQTSRDAQGNVVCKGDAAGQTRQTLENMKKVIEGAGGRMEDVAKTTVFITDIKHREAVGRVRQEFFKGDPPANTLLVISGLADPAFLVEIEAIVPLP